MKNYRNYGLRNISYDLQINPQHWYLANGIITHNCMCLITPRVTPIKQKGSKKYAEFIRNSPPDRRAQLLPKWIKNFTGLGMPLDKLIRPDGLGLVTREALKEKMGAQAFAAANSLGKAKAISDWGVRTNRSGRMTRQTLAEFAPFAHIPEVKKLLADIDTGNPVDGLRLKYLKRKYPDGESINGATTINGWFNAVMNDADATIRERPNETSRYAVHSAQHQLTAIMDKSGQRVTVYTDDGSKLESVWLILSALIKTID